MFLLSYICDKSAQFSPHNSQQFSQLIFWLSKLPNEITFIRDCPLNSLRYHLIVTSGDKVTSSRVTHRLSEISTTIVGQMRETSDPTVHPRRNMTYPGCTQGCVGSWAIHQDFGAYRAVTRDHFSLASKKKPTLRFFIFSTLTPCNSARLVQCR